MRVTPLRTLCLLSLPSAKEHPLGTHGLVRPATAHTEVDENVATVLAVGKSVVAYRPGDRVLIPAAIGIEWEPRRGERLKFAHDFDILGKAAEARHAQADVHL